MKKPVNPMSARFDFTDSRRADYFLSLTRRLGFPLSPQHRILDFGCGRGQNVYHLRRMGLRAYGVDVDERPKEAEAWCAELTSEQLFGKAQLNPYRLPYEDGSFDFIFSDHVLEHVMDYDTAMAEIARVLSPGGISLHIFPSRLRLLESHLKVPLGGYFRNPAWFTFWAALGIGRAWHGQLSAREIGRRNAQWTQSRVNYLRRREIAAHARRHFSGYAFIGAKAVREYLGINVPGLSALVGTFHVRVLMLNNPIRVRDVSQKAEHLLA